MNIGDTIIVREIPGVGARPLLSFGCARIVVDYVTPCGLLGHGDDADVPDPQRLPLTRLTPRGVVSTFPAPPGDLEVYLRAGSAREIEARRARGWVFADRTVVVFIEGEQREIETRAHRVGEDGSLQWVRKGDPLNRTYAVSAGGVRTP